MRVVKLAGLRSFRTSPTPHTHASALKCDDVPVFLHIRVFKNKWIKKNKRRDGTITVLWPRLHKSQSFFFFPSDWLPAKQPHHSRHAPRHLSWCPTFHIHTQRQWDELTSSPCRFVLPYMQTYRTHAYRALHSEEHRPPSSCHRRNKTDVTSPSEPGRSGTAVKYIRWRDDYATRGNLTWIFIFHHWWSESLRATEAFAYSWVAEQEHGLKKNRGALVTRLLKIYPHVPDVMKGSLQF